MNIPSVPSGAMSTQYFDAVARQWDKMRSGFFAPEVRERALDAVDVAPGMVALDVGAGAGFVTEALLARGARVHAVDASPNMVDILRERFPAVDARVGDAEALPYADGAFDRVFANMCLHHVERPAAALAEWVRVLRPGGRLAVTDLDAHDLEFLRTEHHDRWMGFARDDVARWLADAGLADARVESARSTCCATSACGTQEAAVSIFLATGTK